MQIIESKFPFGVDQSHCRFAKRRSKMNSMNSNQIIGKFKIGKKLGAGTYAKTYQAKNIQTNENVAIKVINRTSSNFELINNEISIHSSLQHQNIVKVLEVIKMEKKIYIVMELCENGQLFEYLKVEGAMIEEMAGKLFIQIYSAIKYLHSQGIAHRDIKAENILLDRKMNAKLIDFGFAKAYDVQSSMLQTFCGSPSYAAPEIVKKSKYNAELVDVWSLGVTLYAMLEASLPFDTYNEKMLETNIMSFKWHIPEYCSEEAMDLFRKIFVPAEARINLQGIKSTNFYLKHTKQFLKIPLKHERTKTIEYRLPTPKKQMLPMAICQKKGSTIFLSNRKTQHTDNLLRSLEISRIKPVSLDSKFREIDHDGFRIRLTPMKELKIKNSAAEKLYIRFKNDQIQK